MDLGTILGFIVGVISIFGLGCKWEFLPYFDMPSFGLVFGGCATTVLLSVPFHKIKKMPATFLLSFQNRTYDNADIIKTLIQYAEMARKEGILALEGILDTVPDPFLRQGLQLAVDGTDPEAITHILNSKMEGIDTRHEDNRQGWELCRAAAPSWGAMGTVIGLVQMVKGGVEDPNALIMGVAIALLTTFYGSMVSTWLVGPICDKLAARSADELLYKSIVTCGIMAIQAGDAPRLVEEKLSVFQGGTPGTGK